MDGQGIVTLVPEGGCIRDQEVVYILGQGEVHILVPEAGLTPDLVEERIPAPVGVYTQGLEEVSTPDRVVDCTQVRAVAYIPDQVEVSTPDRVVDCTQVHLNILVSFRPEKFISIISRKTILSPNIVFFERLGNYKMLKITRYCRTCGTKRTFLYNGTTSKENKYYFMCEKGHHSEVYISKILYETLVKDQLQNEKEEMERI